jgi:hypothetical protein
MAKDKKWSDQQVNESLKNPKLGEKQLEMVSIPPDFIISIVFYSG